MAGHDSRDRELLAALASLNKQLVRYMCAELDADSGLTGYRWPAEDQRRLGARMVELGRAVRERAALSLSTD
ncbi:hypothetical protein [Gandjariella thermophila]|uniref:hypothetical protein n=1 Tax=Gandjariella thermophila TaxID=1931992 RepID=UPI0010F7620E|nr:hypothetical protein [Gandjariella thermophila]